MTNRFRALAINTARPMTVIVACVSLWATQNNSKTPAAAPKPAVPAKPVNTTKPVGSPAGGVGAGRAPSIPTAPGRATGPVAGPGRGTTSETPGGRGGGNPAGRSPVLPGGHREVALRGGGSARLDQRGRVAELHRPGMDLHRGPSGIRGGEIRRPDGSRVYLHGHDGYVSRGFRFRDREFAHRTYYMHGVAYDRYYRGYGYHGLMLEAYAPVRYYPTAFYGWVYNPWAAPVPYAWGWVGSPWAVYYGPYFTPYRVYPAAAFWLTDYMISASLAAEYQAQVDAANGVAPQPYAAQFAALSPDVKQAISEEVQRQIALENSEAQQAAQGVDPDPASSSIVRSLQDGSPHVFVAGRDVSAVDSGGQGCSLSQGDAVQLNAAPPADSTTASVVVRASKPLECPVGASVAVQLVDLQEMQNHMRESIGQGMAEMQSHAGQNGFPAIPSPARGAQFSSAFAASAPPPEPNISSAIAQQSQEADNAEREASGQLQAPAAPALSPIPPPSAPAPVISKGLTSDQVTSMLGQPKTILNLGGGKQIYVYEGMKLSFGPDGKLNSIDVE